jgi:hypothetical protein
MRFDTYKNIGIIGKRFSGKTTFINNILDSIDLKRYFYFARSNENVKRESLVFEIYDLKKIVDNCTSKKILVLDDVIYAKEVLRFNKKTWEKFFIDENNRSIVSTSNPMCFKDEPFDIIFLKTSGSDKYHNDYIYENYVKGMCTKDEFAKYIMEDTVAIDYINNQVYTYNFTDDKYKKLFDF